MSAPRTRQRHVAEYDYPALLFPNTITRDIAAPSIGAAVAAQEDDGWYAVTIKSTEETEFSADDERRWIATGQWALVGKYVIGHMIHVDQIENTEHNNILRSNIRSNSKDGYGVKTRCGNWQIASDYDRVLTVEQLEMEKP